MHGLNIKINPLEMNLCNNCLQGKLTRNKFPTRIINRAIQ
jgi:hypothetical protein